MVRLTSLRAFPLLLALLPLQYSCSSGPPPPPPEPLGVGEMAVYLTRSEPPASELFTTDEPLELVLAADLEGLDDDRNQESEDRPAQVLVPGRDGNPVEIPIQVRTRGSFRLQSRVGRDSCGVGGPLRATDTGPDGAYGPPGRIRSSQA